jgi:MFS family permease
VTAATATLSAHDSPIDRGSARHVILQDPSGLIQQTARVNDIAEAVRLAIVPVFLLTAVSGMLNVFAGRLARIVDRARALESLLPAAVERAAEELHRKLYVLSRRAKLVNTSITLCTVCSLLVCTMIAVMFIGAVLRLDVYRLVALLFGLAMVAFIVALISFLREIFIATQNLRIVPNGDRYRTETDTEPRTSPTRDRR